jgi:uncharacterized protein (DUF362 family)
MAGAASSAYSLRPKHYPDRRRPLSRVALIATNTYAGALVNAVLEGLRLFHLNVRGKSVVLKPNLVESFSGPVCTHPALVIAAVQCFQRMGASSVIVAEGPGHERDTEAVLAETGFAEPLKRMGIRFVDLNREELVRTPLRARYTGLGHLWLPRAVRGTDFIVSMPKVKTHHWAGVTLSLKNMFGIVPGMKYGWPKNILHWHGIHESILDVCATVPVDFVIADGIEAMEGNGPLQGELRRLGRIVLADDPVAADATCARLMGLDPRLIFHIAEAGRFLGNMDQKRITMLAEGMPRNIEPFRVIPQFQNLQIRT